VRAGDRIRLGPDVTLRFGWASRTADVPQPRMVELSPRELEIAKLVGEGRTNAEIAELLEISPHTVTAHLSNVFQREGLASRAELASLLASGRVRAVSRGGRSGR
jgi:DNA-binding CsgD family transcriptional regulator